MPTVINCRRKKPNDPSIMYCARAWAGWTASPLGNPFHLKGEESRDRVIADYEIWLRGRIALGDRAVVDAIAAIQEDSLLGCWCAPKRCHCDIVIKIWNEQRGTK